MPLDYFFFLQNLNNRFSKQVIQFELRLKIIVMQDPPRISEGIAEPLSLLCFEYQKTEMMKSP